MAIKKTATTHKTIYKPSHIYAQVGEGTIYDFEEVLRDSTTLSQDDNDTSDIENEVSDDPIKSLVTLGSFQFETTIEDIQKDLVVDLCGFTADTTTGVVFAPAQYSELYAKIVVVIPDGDTNVGLVLPHVQLNTRLIIESLNSALAGISLAGTAKSTYLTVNGEETKTPMYVDYEYTLPTDSTTDLAAPRSTAAGA